MVKAPRHFLAAISDEPSALHGVRFIAQFLRPADDIAVTLLFIAPKPPDVEGAGRILNAALEKGNTALAKAEQLLREAGFRAEGIESKKLIARRDKALEIAAEAKRGLYDAVILGRRARAWFMDLIESSVSSDLLISGMETPLWIARMPEENRRGVLACVDDSQQSHNMVDHLGYILAPEDQDITLLNVYDPGTEDRILADLAFDRCFEILMNHGLDRERIHTKVLESYTPAKAILRHAAHGAYAAVGVGRTGEDRGLARRLFMGSVSRTLLKELTGAALLVHQ